MKKTPQILLCLSLVGVVLLAFAPAAHANCTLTSQIVSHQIGGYLTNCVEPATGRITLISDPVGTQSICQAGTDPSICVAGMPMVTVCNADAANGGTTDAPAQPCQAAAGTVGDGNVTVNFDWGAGSAAQGCPNALGTGAGTTPVAIDVVDAAGNQVQLTVGYSVLLAGFIAENAHMDDGGGGPLPISCVSAGDGNLTLNGITDINPTVRLVSLTVGPPDRNAGVWCDCDTSALGLTFADVSCGSRACGTDPGRVYTRIGPCSDLQSGEFRNAADWTLSATQPDGTGNVTVQTNPAQLEPVCLIGPNICTSPPSAFGSACTVDADCAVFDDCQYIGATNLFGPAVAGTCDPPTCNTSSIGPCNNYGSLVRCNGDFNVICGTCSISGALCDGDASTTLPCGAGEGTCSASEALCTTGSCAIGGADCLLDSECPGECLSGNTGASCTVDADCSSLPESASIGDGILAIGGPAAASDRAVARLAELGKNVLKVEFTVSLEENARSFDILAGGAVLNDSPILAENRGTYVASIAKAGGKLKGAKEITVRTNLDGGGTLMSEPLTIKKGNK